MTGIVEFLTSRLDEDEQRATRASHGSIGNAVYRDLGCRSDDVLFAAKVGSPARVLADVEAKRAILDRFHELVTIGIRNTVDGPQRYVECACGWTGDYEHKLDDDAVFETHLRPLRGPGLTPRWVLIQMASVWRDHPDFDPAWTEET